MEGDPWYMALFGIPKNESGNMLDDDEYAELNDFYMLITQKLNMTVDDGLSRYTFQDLCKPLCDLNEQMQKLMDYSFVATRRYPASEVLSFKVNIGKHVFNRTVDERGELTGAKIMAFYLTAFVENGTTPEKLRHFEEIVSNISSVHNADPRRKVELLVHGTHTAAREIRFGMEEAILLAGIGHAVAFFAFILIVMVSSWFHEQLDFKRISLAFLGLVLPELAIFSSVGVISLAGRELSLLILTSPIGFLVIMMGFYNVFHLTETWDGLLSEARRKQLTQGERLSRTFELMAPAHLTTNFSLIAGFAAANFFLVTNYATLALCVSIALLFNWLFMVFVFAAAIAMPCGCSRAPEKAYVPPGSTRKVPYRKRLLGLITRSFVEPYSKFLSSNFGRLLCLVAFAVVLLLPVNKGLKSLENRMDFRCMVPRNSPAIRGFDIVDLLWNDFLQIVYIIKDAPDFDDEFEYKEFRQFISDAESMPNALPHGAHQSWIFDYYESELDTHYNKYKGGAVDMSKFRSFINGFPYDAWKSGVRYEFPEDSNVPKIKSMLTMIAYNGTKGLRGKYELINACREVAARYPSLNIAAFDTDSRTVDIMDEIPQTALTFLLVLVVAAGAVTLLISWNAAAAVLASVAATSVLGCTVGFATLVDFELDLLTVPMAALIGSLATALSLHFVGDFLLMWMSFDDNHLRRAIELSSGPVLKTAFLASVATSQLFLSQVDLFLFEARLVSIALGVALVHALVLLPTALGLLPKRLVCHESCV
ncbi:patched family protein [Aphelenchoides avenae]|nr:patched family protein [Aphelenchus avenae]